MCHELKLVSQSWVLSIYGVYSMQVNHFMYPVVLLTILWFFHKPLLLLLHLFPLLCGVDVSCETPPSRPVLRILPWQPPLRQVVPDDKLLFHKPTDIKAFLHELWVFVGPSGFVCDVGHTSIHFRAWLLGLSQSLDKYRVTTCFT